MDDAHFKARKESLSLLLSRYERFAMSEEYSAEVFTAMKHAVEECDDCYDRDSILDDAKKSIISLSRTKHLDNWAMNNYSIWKTSPVPCGGDLCDIFTNLADGQMVQQLIR